MSASKAGREPDRTERGPGHAAGRILVAGAALCLLAAGTLMWWRHGEDVFSTFVTSALAWCF